MIRLLSVLCVALAIGATAAAEDKPMKFQSKEGKFAIQFPGKPTESKQKQKTVVGDVDVYLFAIVQKDRAFLATYADYPRGTIAKQGLQDSLDKARDGNIKGVKGKLVSEKKITLKKKDDGREALIALPDKNGAYRVRIYLVGDRLYQVLVAGPDDFAKGKDATAFLDSFEVKD